MKKSRKGKKIGKTIQYKNGMILGTTIISEQIIRCPKCRVNMDKKTNGKFVIDVCPNCSGIFLDKQEVDNIGKQGFINYVLAYFKKPKKVEE